MTRLLATSDWHASSDSEMDAELEAAVSQMLPHAESVDAVVIPGDIYHQRSTPASRLIVASLIQEFASVAPVIICKGNHDPWGDLPLLARLKSQCPIYVFEEPGEMAIDNCTLIVMPWITRAHWTALHPEASILETDLEINKAILAYLRARRLLMPPNKPCILVSHLMVAGALLQNHQPFMGTGFQIGQYDAQEIGFSAGIFGHVHRSQHVGGKGSLFFYPGSPTAQNYGEESDKVFAILDITNAKAEVEWHTLNVVNRITLDIAYKDGHLDYPAYAVLEERLKGAKLRVQYTLPEGEDGLRVKQLVEAEFAQYGPIEIKTDPQLVPKEAVRAASLASAQTYAQKLQAYWDATGSTPEHQDNLIAKLDIALEDVFKA